MRKNRIKIKAFDNQPKFRDSLNIDTVKTYELDYSAWAEDNNEDIESVTWEVDSGQPTISGESLTDNIATAQLSFPQAGNSLVKVTATTDTQTLVFYLEILARDPKQKYTNDYGFRC